MLLLSFTATYRKLYATHTSVPYEISGVPQEEPEFANLFNWFHRKLFYKYNFLACFCVPYEIFELFYIYIFYFVSRSQLFDIMWSKVITLETLISILHFSVFTYDLLNTYLGGCGSNKLPGSPPLDVCVIYCAI